MTWRVTHVDAHQRRRQLLLVCDGRTAATTMAELMYGTAFYLSAVRLRGTS